MNPSRYILPIAGVLLALACIVFATHALVTDVLPFHDWQSGATSAPIVPSVELP
jgi:hypothetical protein